MVYGKKITFFPFFRMNSELEIYNAKHRESNEMCNTPKAEHHTIIEHTEKTMNLKLLGVASFFYV